MERDLSQAIHDADIVHHEPVILRSGETSDHYIDVKRGYGDPELLLAMAAEMQEKISERSNVIAASGYGGIPLASVLAVKLGKHLALVRDSEKNHGKGGFIDGYVPTPSDVVSVVDDVFTSGSSLRMTMQTLAVTGAEVEGCYVVVKRGEGELSVPLTHLLTPNDLT